MPDAITCISEGDDPCGRRRQGVNRSGDVPAGQRKGASLVPRLAISARSPHLVSPCANRMISTGEPGALCCELDYVANSTKSPIGAGDGGEVRHIMRRTTGPRETGNSLFACQLGVCSGRGSEPETAHVCNAFAFISRSTLGVAIGRLEGDVSQRCARIVNKETTMPDSFML